MLAMYLLWGTYARSCLCWFRLPKKKSLPCLPFHFARYLHREPCPAAYTKRSPRQYTVLGISESGQNHLFVHCEILNFTLLLSPAVFSVKATAVLRSRVRAPWGGANSAQATAEAGKSQCIARLRWREMLAAFWLEHGTGWAKFVYPCQSLKLFLHYFQDSTRKAL